MSDHSRRIVSADPVLDSTSPRLGQVRVRTMQDGEVEISYLCAEEARYLAEQLLTAARRATRQASRAYFGTEG